MNVQPNQAPEAPLEESVAGEEDPGASLDVPPAPAPTTPPASSPAP